MRPRKLNAFLKGSIESCALFLSTRALFDPMESDLRSSLLIGRIFVDEPASTSSENALDVQSRREVDWIQVEPV